MNITTDCNSDVDLRADVGDTVVITMTADCLEARGVVWNINNIFVSGPRKADEKPIPPWPRGYGRASSADACNDGWTASWEQWPHGGTGGWVCTHEIPSLG